MENTQSRWRSKAAWVALFGFLGLLLGNLGVFDAIGLTNETYKALVESLLGALVAFGIFNNPTNPEGF